jgi:hypothetical protein
LGKYRGAEFGAAVRPCATCKAQLRRVFHALGSRPKWRASWIFSTGPRRGEDLRKATGRGLYAS